nr:PREDICTED: platelet glycoprotein Ib beta chain-like [Latimeria chalumnae]|eukprot:XP_006004455.1 PREDICTED: platelet glycoprotein Ib beta chain-like [Latimeria chalumnae]
MLICPGLAVLFFLMPFNAEPCPAPCKCISIDSQSFQVNCSFRGLQEVPVLPNNTTELNLQDNLLKAVTPGRFDNLWSLKKINLSNNPWNCDCNILYFKTWLEDQTAFQVGVTCLSPASLSMKPIAQLTANDFLTCSKHRTKSCYYFITEDCIFCILIIILVVLMVWLIRITKALSFTLNFYNHDTEKRLQFSQSKKVKQWRRFGVCSMNGHNEATDLAFDSLESTDLTVQWTIQDQENAPLLRENIEILPEIANTLYIKHNIKLKIS